MFRAVFAARGWKGRAVSGNGKGAIIREEVGDNRDFVLTEKEKLEYNFLCITVVLRWV